MEVGVGIDMGGTMIKIGLVTGGKLVAGTKVPATAHVTLAQRLEEIALEVDKLLSENNCVPLGIGIAFPGIVDSNQHKILSRYVKYPDAQQISLPSWAWERWRVPLALENDARAALLGEWQYGAGLGCNDLVLITLGTGVGTAVMIEGKMLRGKNFIAGNLGGHVCINLHGNACNCGSTGCVESEASTWALQKIVMQSPEFADSALSREKEINFHAVFSCAERGDRLAMAIKTNCLKAWSVGILNLIISYDPERVVLGGGIMNSRDIVIPQVKEMIRKDVWLKDHAIELVAAQQLEYAGILGLYYLLTQHKSHKAIL